MARSGAPPLYLLICPLLPFACAWDWWTAVQVVDEEK